MEYSMKINTSRKENYGSKRNTSNIKYIVIHYTGNDGDHDESNANYFKNNIVKASAHYFVDDDSVTQSVPDDYVAWSVGGKKYSDCSTTGGGKYYSKCTNDNSISIELCDVIKNGTVYPSDKTINNALNLTKALMKKYNVPANNVIRHFDVNGKHCPAYWMNDSKWKSAFHNKLISFSPYKVKVKSDTLTIRSGAGKSFMEVGEIKKGEVYTIVEEKMNGSIVWGKLKSDAGWISLKYTSKC